VTLLKSRKRRYVQTQLRIRTVPNPLCGCPGLVLSPMRASSCHEAMGAQPRPCQPCSRIGQRMTDKEKRRPQRHRRQSHVALRAPSHVCIAQSRETERDRRGAHVGTPSLLGSASSFCVAAQPHRVRIWAPDAEIVAVGPSTGSSHEV
jgi:hypothetical protein